MCIRCAVYTSHLCSIGIGQDVLVYTVSDGHDHAITTQGLEVITDAGTDFIRVAGESDSSVLAVALDVVVSAGEDDDYFEWTAAANIGGSLRVNMGSGAADVQMKCSSCTEEDGDALIVSSDPRLC